jgi:hypothetical protein
MISILSTGLRRCGAVPDRVNQTRKLQGEVWLDSDYSTVHPAQDAETARRSAAVPAMKIARQIARAVSSHDFIGGGRKATSES